MSLYPFKFEPIYKEKIWGGRALERLWQRPLPAGQAIGESWELADLPEGQSRVAEGPETGALLGDLLKRLGAKMLGTARPSPAGRFPLLLKYLDANEPLSLQVHPDDAAASRLGGSATSKSECWYVLESRQGSIYKGVKPGVTARDLRAALDREARTGRSEALCELVVRHAVRAGDFHYLPAGVVHALGAGVVVAEVQTPSDTTYRVSDWGRGRQLHVEEALACIHFSPAPPPPGQGGETLVCSREFRVDLRRIGPAQMDLPCRGLCVWMVLAGRGRIVSQYDEEGVGLSPGQTVLLPAELPKPVLSVGETMTVLDITVPHGAGLD